MVARIWGGKDVTELVEVGVLNNGDGDCVGLLSGVHPTAVR